MKAISNIASITKKGLGLLACVLLVLQLKAQEQTRNYTIIYKGDVVGKMQFYQKKTNEKLFLKITSATKMRLVMNVNVDIVEEATFENGKLLYSKLNRQVNGKEKANNTTKAKDNKYITSSDGKPGFINESRIDYNFAALFYKEPVNQHKIYSENYQQLLAIEKVASNQYKIELPGGNYNYYFYENGVCNRVEVHHSFYTIEMRLL